MNMKQEILDTLTTKFQGVSQSILNRVADKLVKIINSTDDVATAVEGVTFQQVLESYGDSRATEAQRSAVANYEKKHGLKNGKLIEQSEPDSENEDNTVSDSEIPAWAKALIESNKELQKQVSVMQGEKITATRTSQLAEIISTLPASIRKAYSHINVESLTDEDFNTLKADITNEAAEIAKETQTRGALFGRPSVQGGTRTQQTQPDNQGEATDAEATAVIEKLGIK